MDNSPDSLNVDELVCTLGVKLHANYIFPEVTEQICANIASHHQASEYADIREGEFLALMLTMHLQEVIPDEHLWVKWQAETLPDDDDQLRLNPERQEERKMEAALDNHGVYRVERLAGNVGYLDL